MNEINLNIGNNIKQIRKSRNLTIEELALSSGVSKSMISEIERGIRNPSITLLWDIANSLKIPLNYLLKQNSSSTANIYKKENSEPINANGFLFQTIMNFDENKKFEIYSTEYLPNTCTDSSVHFPGVEEYALIISGTIIVYVDNTRYEVSAGDVINFVADNPHYYCNETDNTVKAFILMFYPDNIR